MRDEAEEEALAGAYYMTPADENSLTYDAVPMVDLSLAYSPVLPSQSATPQVQACGHVLSMPQC